jgi:hypothetical protein
MRNRVVSPEEWLKARLDLLAATQRETAGACAGSGNATALGAADLLCLAAAPTFAIMALLTGVLGGGRPDMLCSAAQDASPLNGMVAVVIRRSPDQAAPSLSRRLVRHWADRRNHRGNRCKRPSSSAARRASQRRPPRCSRS